MKIKKLFKQVGVICGVAMGLCATTVQAVSPDKFQAAPPQGWDHLCTGNSIKVKPTAKSRLYTGSGTCWVNITNGDKTDSAQQQWVNAKVALQGSYALQTKTFAEQLTFTMPSGKGIVRVSGVCDGDPWETTAQCNSSAPNVDLFRSFGWSVTPPPGPMSRNIFGPGLVQALLSNQTSKPPLAPVDLKALRMPNHSGQGTVGQVEWNVPDLSDNKWILQFEIEYSTASPNSAFTKAGQVAGPGMKTNVAQWEVGRGFTTPFKLQNGLDYYFRVCSVNDVGRACTSVKAREPSKAELIAGSSPGAHGGMLGQQPTNSPTTPPKVKAVTGGFGAALGNRGGPAIGPHSTMSAPGAGTVVASAKSTATTAVGSPLPDLTFSFVTVQKRTYNVTGGTHSIIYDEAAGPSSPQAVRRGADACNRTLGFPLQLIVKNIGQADFVPKGSAQAVGVNIGPWNSAKDLVKIPKGGSQVMDFNVSLAAGRYTLQAQIDLHQQVAESRSDNNTLSWPFEVKCDTRAMAPAPVPAPTSAGEFGGKRPGVTR